MGCLKSLNRWGAYGLLEVFGARGDDELFSMFSGSGSEGVLGLLGYWCIKRSAVWMEY